MAKREINNSDLRFFVDDEDDIVVIDTAVPHAMEKWVARHFGLDPDDEDDFDQIVELADEYETGWRSLEDMKDVLDNGFEEFCK